MNKINMRFLSSVLVLCFCSVSAAHAVPTVKRLGTNTARVGGNVTSNPAPTASSTNSLNSTQRLGSIRSVNTVAPSISENRVSGSISSSKDVNRLGIKVVPYMQTGKSIKTSAAPGSTGQTTKPSVDLNSLEERIGTLEDTIQNKQNTLSVGNGIVLENDEISVDPDIDELPNRVAILADDVDGLATEVRAKLTEEDLDDYYTKEQVDARITESAGPAATTLYDWSTYSRKKVSIVNIFDSDEFEENYLNN